MTKLPYVPNGYARYVIEMFLRGEDLPRSFKGSNLRIANIKGTPWLTGAGTAYAAQITSEGLFGWANHSNVFIHRHMIVLLGDKTFQIDYLANGEAVINGARYGPENMRFQICGPLGLFAWRAQQQQSQPLP